MTRFEQNKLSQFFVQGGKTIQIPAPADTVSKILSNLSGDNQYTLRILTTTQSISSSSNITPEFCTNQFKAFSDRDRFSEVGGFPQLNAALQRPMVLVMSIWDDVSYDPPCLAYK